MGGRSESRSSADVVLRRSNPWDEGDNSIEGVELTFVCNGTVPVLTMDKSSTFHENASWMLQSALSSSGKADGLYEYYDDMTVLRECRRLGLRDEEVSLVRLKQPELRHVKAVGTTGKRAVMLACVVALACESGYDKMGALWKELRDYDLEAPFVKILRRGHPARGEEAGAREAPESDEDIAAALEEEGVEMQLVRGHVPVIGLAKESIFTENASWLLQTATGSSGRADQLYDYDTDRKVEAECWSLGLSPQEVGLVRLRAEGKANLQAVGTCGKRSIMLSLVVAMVVREEVQAKELLGEVQGYDPQLDGPVRVLLRAALRAAGKSLPSALAPPRKEREPSSERKRKWEWPDEGNSRSSKTPSKRRGGSKAPRPEGPNAKVLDKQLDAYWGDEYR